MTMTYGVAALARPTFDVEFAEQMKNQAFAALDRAGIDTVGPRELLFDGLDAQKAMAEIRAAGRIDLLLVLQVTFTDASMTVKLAREASAPIAVWAFPEPRLGGRLRLNAFCGLNLATHALGKADIPYSWLYAAPDGPQLDASLRALAEPTQAKPGRIRTPPKGDDAEARRVLASLEGATIGVIGQHPEGFDTCEYDERELKELTGVGIATIDLQTLFEKAKGTDEQRAATEFARAQASLEDTDRVDQEQLDRSIRVFCALEDIQREHKAKSLAVRCWPEMFTEYGCAACGPMAMMNQSGVPSACEADVQGSLSALILQELAGEPSWMADLVDLDTEDDTGVLWHCGLAPLSMCDPVAPAQATIHTNRKMPLLHQFPLKPGRVTIARLSSARNQTVLMLAGGEILRAPMAFTGTSGVVRFDKPAAEVCTAIMEEGLEHHYALAYGEHRDALRAIAARLGIGVLELA